MDGKVRTCPFCAESIQATLTLCQKCHRFSRPAGTVERSKRSLIDVANASIAQLEAKFGLPRSITTRFPGISSVQAKFAGVLFLALSLPSFVTHIRYGGSHSFRSMLAFIALGLAVLAGARLLRRDGHPKREGVQPVGGTSIVFLGYRTNVLVMQVVASIVMTLSAGRAEIERAWWAAVVIVGLAVALRRTQHRWISLSLGAVAVVYLAYLSVVWDFGYEFDSFWHAVTRPSFAIPVGPVLWIIAALAILPQVQDAQLRGFGIGRMRGDFTVPLFGSEVPIAIVSAFLLWAAWTIATAHAVLVLWLVIIVALGRTSAMIGLPRAVKVGLCVVSVPGILFLDIHVSKGIADWWRARDAEEAAQLAVEAENAAINAQEAANLADNAAGDLEITSDP